MITLEALNIHIRAYIKRQHLYNETDNTWWQQMKVYTWSIQRREIQNKKSFAGQNQLYVQSRKW